MARSTGRWAWLWVGGWLGLLAGCGPPAAAAQSRPVGQVPSAAAAPQAAAGPARSSPGGEGTQGHAPGAAAAEPPSNGTDALRSGAPMLPPEAAAASIRPATEWLADPALSPRQRVALAERTKRVEVEQLFAAAGVAFPPAELLWRGFKREHQLEVWASESPGAPMRRIATYEICAMSGELGPKRHEGDLQVPEGFYQIAYLWPWSSFHLSMNIGYPNRSDRILGGPRAGSAIMIHGNCVSAGCLAMSDERIEELWVMAASLGRGGGRVHVHLFPTRELDALLADEDQREHREFWRNLREGWALFEQHHRLLRVGVDWRGRYTFSVPAGTAAVEAG